MFYILILFQTIYTSNDTETITYIYDIPSSLPVFPNIKEEDSTYQNISSPDFSNNIDESEILNNCYEEIYENIFQSEEIITLSPCDSLIEERTSVIDMNPKVEIVSFNQTIPENNIISKYKKEEWINKQAVREQVVRNHHRLFKNIKFLIILSVLILFLLGVAGIIINYFIPPICNQVNNIITTKVPKMNNIENEYLINKLNCIQLDNYNNYDEERDIDYLIKHINFIITNNQKDFLSNLLCRHNDFNEVISNYIKVYPGKEEEIKNIIKKINVFLIK